MFHNPTFIQPCNSLRRLPNSAKNDDHLGLSNCKTILCTKYVRTSNWKRNQSFLEKSPCEIVLFGALCVSCPINFAFKYHKLIWQNGPLSPVDIVGVQCERPPPLVQLFVGVWFPLSSFSGLAVLVEEMFYHITSNQILFLAHILSYCLIAKLQNFVPSALLPPRRMNPNSSGILQKEHCALQYGKQFRF